MPLKKGHKFPKVTQRSTSQSALLQWAKPQVISLMLRSLLFLLIAIAILIIFAAAFGSDKLIRFALEYVFGNVIAHNVCFQIIGTASDFGALALCAVVGGIALIRWGWDVLIIGWRNANAASIKFREKTTSLLKFIGSALLVTVAFTILFLILLGMVTVTVLLAQIFGLSTPFFEAVKLVASWTIAIGYVVDLALSLVQVVRDIFREIFAKP